MSTMKTFYRQSRHQQMEQLRLWSTEIKIPQKFKSNPVCDNSIDKMEEKVDAASLVVNPSQVVKEEKVDQASVMENCGVVNPSQVVKEEMEDLARLADNFEGVNHSQMVKEEKVDQASVISWMENCDVMESSQQDRKL